jgi:hypothetical protein
VLVEEEGVDFVAALFRSIWAPSQGDCRISTDHPFRARSFAVGVPVGLPGVKEARCTPTHGTSGGRRPGFSHL